MQIHSDKISYKQWLQFAATSLREAGIENPQMEAIYLYRACARSDIPPKAPDIIADALLAKCRAGLQRRCKHEPLAKIMGVREFWSLSFEINEHVLDPRGDSENLVTLGLTHIQTYEAPAILDIGTGTGCLLLSLLHETPSAQGTGCDISSKALAVARQNAQAMGLHPRFVESNLVDAIDGQFDLIVSNPPYIPSNEIATLDRGVRAYDPHIALDGGADGLDFYRALAQDTKPLLADQGLLGVEIGIGQAHDVCAIFAKHNWQFACQCHDIQGNIRALGFAGFYGYQPI